MTIPLQLLPYLLPLAVRWVARTERRILLIGRPLEEPSLSDARAMGVMFPEKIRTLVVPSIPFPDNPILRFAGRASGLVSPHTAGMALRYGIFVRHDCIDDRRLVAHECVHTAQYERLGGIEPFLRLYLRECLEVGYRTSPLEVEAARKSEGICD